MVLRFKYIRYVENLYFIPLLTITTLQYRLDIWIACLYIYLQSFPLTEYYVKTNIYDIN